MTVDIFCVIEYVTKITLNYSWLRIKQCKKSRSAYEGLKMYLQQLQKMKLTAFIVLKIY